MTPAGIPCPYVGLQPFQEEDYRYFFGRERDVRVICSNLLARPLTVVYGASGVGKSSVLRAGVLPHLRTDPEAVAIYYNTWQSETFLQDLTEQCRVALHAEPGDPLDKMVGTGPPRLFLLLDQFEELLLYHQTSKIAEEFDSVLARLINRDDVAINVLIGIREDALSRFDQRYSIRIADLLGNTHPLDHLDDEAARRAILEPLRVANEGSSSGETGYSAEPELVTEILRQVQSARYAVTEDDEGAATSGAGRVETPFLQLVLETLWNEEAGSQSRTLRLETLVQIGGARQIVDKHVNRVLSRLASDEDREIAARMFMFLVTPSRSKISQATGDLVDYAKTPESSVRPILSLLSDKAESRILRRLDSPERYEIFHDVLAQPILDWRKKHFAERERLEEQQKTDRAKREVRRLRALVVAMVLLVFAVAAFGWYALIQRRQAREAADLVRDEAHQREIATNEARAAEDRATATQALLQAAQAEKAGQSDLANKLRVIADQATKQALEQQNLADDARGEIAVLADGKDKNYRDAQQQIADLHRERDQLKTQVSGLANEKKELKDQVAVLELIKAQGLFLEGRVRTLTTDVERFNEVIVQLNEVSEKESASGSVKQASESSNTAVSSMNLLRTLDGHSKGVEQVATIHNGRRAVSASDDKTLKVWDLETGLVVRPLEGHSGKVTDVVISPDGRRAVSASIDKTLKLWDLETGKALRTLGDHSGPVYGVAVSSDWRRLVSASADGTLKVWDLDTGRLVRTTEGRSGAFYSVAVRTDGRQAVSAGYDRTLKVWDLETGRVLRILERHSAGVMDVAVSSDWRRAVSASDKYLKVWDLQTGKEIRTLTGHTEDVINLAMSQDGKYAVSASSDRTVKIWDLESGVVVANYVGVGKFYSCAFVGPRTVVAGDSLGHVHVLSFRIP